MGTSGGSVSPLGRWSWVQWHRVYYLLAAFDVLTVSMSLWVNTRIMAIYRASIEVGQAWDELLHDTSARAAELFACTVGSTAKKCTRVRVPPEAGVAPTVT